MTFGDLTFVLILGNAIETTSEELAHNMWPEIQGSFSNVKITYLTSRQEMRDNKSMRNQRWRGTMSTLRCYFSNDESNKNTSWQHKTLAQCCFDTEPTPEMLNWAKRTSWGWWDEWNDTALQTLEIRAFAVWGRARYTSVTEALHNIESLRVREEETFFSLNFAGQNGPHSGLRVRAPFNGARTRDLRLSKWAALTTAPESPPVVIIIKTLNYNRTSSRQYTTRWPNAGSISGQHHRRWPDIDPTLGELWRRHGLTRRWPETWFFWTRCKHGA